jgi:hypothetical protein
MHNSLQEARAAPTYRPGYIRFVFRNAAGEFAVEDHFYSVDTVRAAVEGTGWTLVSYRLPADRMWHDVIN